MQYAIYKDNYKVLNTAFPQVNWLAKWTEVLRMSERCVHDIKVNMVTCIKPANQWIKVNMDGSALSNLGRLEAGGILRDNHGRL